MAKRRAPSRGAASEQIDLICLAAAHNLDAERAHQTRTGRARAKPPPSQAHPVSA